jgi:hypothetical protein
LPYVRVVTSRVIMPRVKSLPVDRVGVVRKALAGQFNAGRKL